MRSAAILSLLIAASLQSQPASAQATFTPGEANDPATCRDLWKDVGLPRYARATDRDVLPVCHTRYVLSHNNNAKTPDWVFEQLKSTMFANGSDRPDQHFTFEKNVPPDKAARDADYTNSGFDRGHQAPSADFAADDDLMKESFTLSNAVPQQGVGFNQHIWKNLEEQTRKIARARRQVYVITGPIYRDADGNAPVISARINSCGHAIELKSTKNKKEIGDRVTVPVGLYKIIYDPNWPRVNAYILPNINHTEAGEASSPAAYLKEFQVTVHVVERFAGLEFFRNLPQRQHERLNQTCGQIMLR